ncbi:hypothetical protein Tsubulata_019321 [Turnera subulata]|uniref:Uncharacterized protein n=1 Tax=Turnera subulata TaxID=218843 RepID=A0A9Q0F2P7_9ROSI|nr:hypothetical protein Tsubulata_019321 [Turnera subulata]
MAARPRSGLSSTRDRESGQGETTVAGGERRWLAGAGVALGGLRRASWWWSPMPFTAGISSLWLIVKEALRRNTLTQARRNISDHYDLSNELFATFLDERMQYSCAVFKSDDEDLKTAQMSKISLLIEKFEARIDREHEVLEIGFGWGGGMAIEIVKRTGCKYTGITISNEQLKLAEKKVKDAGLQDHIRFLFCDYRDLPETHKYDRILACEMLETIGDENMENFFRSCDSLLAQDGLLVIQVYDNIPYRAYPVSSEIQDMGFDEKFITKWEYYLDYCAAGYKSYVVSNYQVLNYQEASWKMSCDKQLHPKKMMAAPSLLESLARRLAARFLRNYISSGCLTVWCWWSPMPFTAGISSLWLIVKEALRRNTLTQARRNTSDHYDLSNELFATFLDETMQYSCAVFKSDDEDLKTAQMRKVSLLIEKARIDRKHEVLEIGFGWGAMAIEVVKRTGCKYTGITLSIEQLKLAEKRVKDAGLEDHIRFLLCDYRELPETHKYDRILSCEVIECTGDEYVEEFFRSCDSLLAEDGLFVIQRSVEHVENIGISYYNTLRCWRNNFLKNQRKIQDMGFDEKFIRKWEYYFDYCAAGFKSYVVSSYHIVFSRPGNTVALGNPYRGGSNGANFCRHSGSSLADVILYSLALFTPLVCKFYSYFNAALSQLIPAPIRWL